MEGKFTKVLLSTVLIGFVILIFLVINHYFNNIETTKIYSIEEWSKVSDFFGGIVNTIISFFSLIVLGIITLVVANQSNSENKKNNLLLKRIESYDKLASFFPKLILSTQEVAIATTIIKDKIEKKELDMNSEMSAIQEYSKVMTETFSCIVSFELLYGHLYQFDFNSNNYKKLIYLSKQINDIYNSVRQKLILKEYNFQNIDFEPINEFVVVFNNVLKQLKGELK